MKKLFDYIKNMKSSHLIFLVICVLILVAIFTITRADKIASIFDPSAFMPQDQQEEQNFDATGYGLKDNSAESGNEGDGKEEKTQDDEEDQKKIRNLNTDATKDSYRGNKNVTTDKSGKKVYVDNGKNGTQKGGERVNDGSGPGADDPSQDGKKEDETGDRPTDDGEENNNTDGQDDTKDNDSDKQDGGNTDDGTNGAEPIWEIDDIAVNYRNEYKEVRFYMGQVPSKKYVKGNVTVISSWHDKTNPTKTKTQTETVFSLAEIPDAYNHTLTTQDVGDSFSLELTCHSVTKKVTCSIFNDFYKYRSITVSYKNVPTFAEGETLTTAQIQKSITLDVYGKTYYGEEEVYFPDEVNYKVIFQNETASPDILTADIEYYGNAEGTTVVLTKKNAVTYDVKQHKLTVMYDDETVLDTIYTDEKTVVLNKSYNGVCVYNEMIRKLQANQQYTVNEEGYLTSLFLGWSPYLPAKKEDCTISYSFKSGQHEQIMYAVPLEKLLEEGYLVKQEGTDQILVGYLGSGQEKKTKLEVPYGITKVSVDSAFKTSAVTKDLSEIIFPDTVNNADLSSLGDKFGSLKTFSVSEGNQIYSADGQGILYTQEEVKLVKVPVACTEFFVPDSVREIGVGAFSDAAKYAGLSRQKLQITMECDLPPTLENTDNQPVFGKTTAEVTILVPDSREEDMIEDLPFKRYVASWGSIIDEEFGKSGTAAVLLDTPGHIQTKYQNTGGNLYSMDGEHKVLEFMTGDAENIYDVEEGVYAIASYAFEDSKNIKAVNLPESVRELRDYSFASLSGGTLRNIDIAGEQTMTIGAFVLGSTVPDGFRIYLSNRQNENSGWLAALSQEYGEERAKEVLIFVEEDLWLTEDGCVYMALDADLKKLRLYSAPANLKEFTAPKEAMVTEIAKNAFYGCSNLIYLELPDVEKIGEDAFLNCVNLEIVVLSSPNLSQMDDAFSGCQALETVMLSQSSIKASVPAQAEKLQGTQYFAKNRIVYEKSGSACIVHNLPTDTTGNITLEEETNEIADRAFFGCESVTGIDGSSLEKMKKIGNYAFANCSQLSGILIGGTINRDLPLNAVSIGNYAFYGCQKLSELTIGESCATLGAHCFDDCASLNNVTWLGDTTQVGDAAFYGCEELMRVDFGKSEGEEEQNITTIGSKTFENIQSLGEINVHTDLANIGNYCFSGCSNMVVYIDAERYDGFRSFGDYAFAGTKIGNTFRDSTKLTEIGEGAFMNCTELLRAVISPNLKEISDYCYAGCSKMSYFAVTSNSALEKIGEGAFSGCTILSTIYNLHLLPKLTKIGANAFSEGEKNGVKFGACTSLKNIAFPKTLKVLEKNVFSGCSSLESADFTSAEQLNELGEGVFSGCGSLENIELSQTEVEAVPKNAFSDCTTLSTVTTPASLKNIEANAFLNCENLDTILLKDSYTVLSVGETAFEGTWDNGKIRVFVPYTKDHVLRDSYRSAKDWQKALHEQQEKVIQDIEFEASSFIRDGGLYTTKEDGSYQLLKVISLKNNTFSVLEGTSGIAADAFLDRREVAIVVLSSQMEQIPEGIFEDCENLETLVMRHRKAPALEGNLFGTGDPNPLFKVWVLDSALESFQDWSSYSYTVKSFGCDYMIDKGIFYGAHIGTDGVQRYILNWVPRTFSGKIVIRADVDEIADSAGENCQNITDIDSADSVVRFGNRAFAGCTSLRTIDFRSTSSTKLTTIGEYAFEGCTSLVGRYASAGIDTQLLLPTMITSVGKGAFKNCSSLSYVRFQCNVTEIPEECFSGCESLATFAPTATALGRITNIGEKAFYHCKGITSISWSNMTALKIIGKQAYEGCSALVQATFAAALTRLDDRCFYGTNLEMMSFNGTIPPALGDNLMEEDVQKQVKIYVPSGKDGATCLDYINTWQKKYPLLAENIIGKDGTAFRAVSNVLYEVNPDDTKELTALRVPTSLSKVTIYNSSSLYCVALGEECMINCKQLTSLAIPNKVKTVERRAFANCSGLSEISISAAMLQSVGEEAFLNCTSLQNLTLPTSLLRIGDRAFAGCESFQNLTIQSYSPYVLGTKVFGDTVNQNVRIIVPYESYETYVERWGAQLDQEYGNGSGIRMIEGLSDTKKIENGIYYTLEKEQWVISEKSGQKADSEKKNWKDEMEEGTAKEPEEAQSSEDSTESAEEGSTEGPAEEATSDPAGEGSAEETTSDAEEGSTDATDSDKDKIEEDTTATSSPKDQNPESMQTTEKSPEKGTTEAETKEETTQEGSGHGN